MNKKQLRVEYINKRLNLTGEEYNNLNTGIVSVFLQEFWGFKAPIVHSYLPIASKREVNTLPIIEWFSAEDCQIVIPKTNYATNEMRHYVLNEATILVENPWGIKEPENGIEVQVGEIDAVLVPLLIFDESGHRVGYGKGFYDRFLSKCKESTVKIGLSLFPPIEKILNTNHYDVKLDYGITPKRMYKFK